MIAVTVLFIAATASAEQRVLAANLTSSSVTELDVVTGEVTDLVPSNEGGLQNGTGIALGPDGFIYVGSSANSRILRFDSETGEFAGTVVQGGHLTRPFSLVFDSDGRLVVSSGNAVLRFTTDGAFVDSVASGPELNTPIGLRFGPDGLLYVANAGGNNILRYNIDTGSLVDVFAHDSPLRFPSDLVFDENGRLFVSSAFTSMVHVFDTDGSEETIELPEGAVPVGLDMDRDGWLYISDFGQSRILRHDTTNPRSEVEILATEGLAGPENIVIAY